MVCKTEHNLRSSRMGTWEVEGFFVFLDVVILPATRTNWCLQIKGVAIRDIKVEADECSQQALTERAIADIKTMTSVLIWTVFHLPLEQHMFIKPSVISSSSCFHVVKPSSPTYKCKKMFTVSPAELKNKSVLLSAPVGPSSALSQVIHSKWKQESTAKCSGMVRTHFRVCTVITVWMRAFPHQNMTTGCTLHLL